MSRRDYDRSSEPRRARSHAALPRTSADPVLALQRAVGNRSTTRVLARKGNAGTLEHSLRFGKHGPIELAESNVADWIGGKSDASDLTVTTLKGKHSDDLKRLFENRTRTDIEIQSVTGQNSWVIVTFKNARIRDYTADPSAKTEGWRATRFDAVDIKRTSIGKPRP